MAAPEPIVQYLGIQRRVDRELSRILARAARDAQRRVAALSLAPPGVGARVRQAQLTGVLRAIRELQEQLWLEGVGPLIASNLTDAQLAAERAAAVMDDVLFAALPDAQAELMRASIRQTAEAGLVAEAQRRTVELSPRVWRNADLASGAIQATIRSGIIQGLSARELARDVARMILPSTPGGVSYSAMRLARTELNNAFHARQIAAAQNRPWVEGVRWNLSGSHPRSDTCDQLANEDAHDMGRGVFPKTEVPRKPHPHCFCYLTYEMQDEDDFIAGLRRTLRPARTTEQPTSIARARPTSPQVKVLNWNDHLGGTDWQRSPDRAVRASNLWAQTYEGMDAMRLTLRNINAGREPLAGVDLSGAKLRAFTEAKNVSDLSVAYGEQELRDEVVSGALAMQEMLATAQPTQQALFRGMRIADPRSTLHPGEVIDVDLSSATPKSDVATMYARNRLEGEQKPVLMVIRPGVRATNIDDGRMMGGQRGSEEHLVTGRLNVVEIREENGLTIVEVEGV